MYRIRVKVVEVKGHCALGYKKGDEFTIENYYILEGQKKRICIHALNSMISIIMPLLKGFSAKQLGIGPTDNEAYVQCPDPGKPYTKGGTVIFKLIREEL